MKNFSQLVIGTALNICIISAACAAPVAPSFVQNSVKATQSLQASSKDFEYAPDLQIAADGSERTSLYRVAADGSERTPGFRVAADGSERTPGFRTA